MVRNDSVLSVKYTTIFGEVIIQPYSAVTLPVVEGSSWSVRATVSTYPPITGLVDQVDHLFSDMPVNPGVTFNPLAGNMYTLGSPNGSRPVSISDSFQYSVLSAAASENGGYGVLNESWTTVPYATAVERNGTNAASIAATSWGNVITYTTPANAQGNLVVSAGASLDVALIAQTGAWRLTAGGVEVRKFLVPAGVSVHEDVMYYTNLASTVINLDFYNTSATAIAIGAVLGWMKTS
ncbi:MAG: hypothetical protein ACYCT2_09010 [Thermoplasmataceae archaeon]